MANLRPVMRKGMLGDRLGLFHGMEFAKDGAKIQEKTRTKLQALEKELSTLVSEVEADLKTVRGNLTAAELLTRFERGMSEDVFDAMDSSLPRTSARKLAQLGELKQAMMVLQTLDRNIDPKQTYSLDFDELVFLGF